MAADVRHTLHAITHPFWLQHAVPVQVHLPEEMMGQPVGTELGIPLQLTAHTVNMHDAIARPVAVCELKVVQQAPCKVSRQVGIVLGHGLAQTV